LRVDVRDNDIDQALRMLKKKMHREGLFRELRRRRAYEKPSERRIREKKDAIRRADKLARKQAQREGLLSGSKMKPLLALVMEEEPLPGPGHGGPVRLSCCRRYCI
jgi:small subunit ribosomal protein S21